MAYAPVVTWFAIRLMIVMGIIFCWALCQVDSVMAYPQAPIETDIYMELPQGVQTATGNSKDHVLKLLKNIYGRCGARQCGTKCYPYNPSLGLFCGTCLHTTSDNDQTRPEHTTQIHSKHHHHGGGSARPSSDMDLMNQDDRMCGRPGGEVG